MSASRRLMRFRFDMREMCFPELAVFIGTREATNSQLKRSCLTVSGVFQPFLCQYWTTGRDPYCTPVYTQSVIVGCWVYMYSLFTPRSLNTHSGSSLSSSSLRALTQRPPNRTMSREWAAARAPATPQTRPIAHMIAHSWQLSWHGALAAPSWLLAAPLRA